MKFRHEVKHEISLSDYYVLRQRLGVVAKPDIHGENGSYRVRSLYFDDAYDTALKEKINGVNLREKFRLRFYDGDVTYIRLEKKSKINGLCQKVYAVLDIKDAQKILKGDIRWMLDSETVLLRELYEKMITKEKPHYEGDEVTVYKIRVESTWYYCSEATYNRINVGDDIDNYNVVGNDYRYIY